MLWALTKGVNTLHGSLQPKVYVLNTDLNGAIVD